MSKAQETKRNDPIGGIDYKHPAMVTVSFSRQSFGGGVSLFGSSVKNNSVISLKISRAQVNRSLARDWVHGEISPIIEVLLSPSQFAECITTMNMGSGVPGTLCSLNNEHFDLPELPSKSQQFKDEISETVEETLRSLKEAQKKVNEILNDDKPLGKKGKIELRSLLVSLERLADSTLPFIGEQFAKQMSKTVSEAKAEVDAFVTKVAIDTGLKTLTTSAPKMIGFECEDE